jgi:hypothetical protein
LVPSKEEFLIVDINTARSNLDVLRKHRGVVMKGIGARQRLLENINASIAAAERTIDQWEREHAVPPGDHSVLRHRSLNNSGLLRSPPTAKMFHPVI